MTVTIKLKSDIEIYRTSDRLHVTLLMYTQGPESKWPLKEEIDRQIVSLKGLFGYKSLPEITKEIVRAQNKMMAKFRTTSYYYSLVQNLSKQYTIGESVVQDANTTSFIKKFT